MISNIPRHVPKHTFLLSSHILIIIRHSVTHQQPRSVDLHILNPLSISMNYKQKE